MSVTSTDALQRPGGWLVGLVGGVVSALLGLAPWWASGQPLPLQNLWRVNVLPDAMPWVALPLSQYALATLIALLASPGLVAGFALRAGVRAAPPGVAVGMLSMQVAAVAQSFSVLVPGLRPGALTSAYLAGLAATCLVGLVAAQVVFGLVTSVGGPRVAVGVGLAGVPIVAWVMSCLSLIFGPYQTPVWLAVAALWAPAVIVGCVLAWCGLGTRAQGVAWVVNLAQLWLVPALLAAAGASVARNTVRGGLAEIVDTFVGTLIGALGPTHEATRGVLLAALIATAGLVLARVRRPPAATPDPSSPPVAPA